MHQLAPHLWTAYGYCGRGIVMATLMGRDIARHIAGRNNEAPVFPLTDIRPLASSVLARWAVGATMQWYRWSDWLDGRSLRQRAARAH